MATFLLVLAVGLYLTWLAVLYLSQDRMMFPTYLLDESVQGSVPHDAQVVLLDLDDGGQVEGWFFAAPQTDDNDAGPAVIFAHGNAELIDHQLVMVQHYQAMGLAVLLVEYRGYGRSAGRPGKDAIAHDLRRFYNWLVQQTEVDPARIVYHGRSLGAAVVTELASEHPPVALILESAFTSVTALARRYAAPPFLVRNAYQTDRIVAELDRPVLILHGSHDEIIPVSHGRRLAELAQQATYVEYPATHNTFPGFDRTRDYWQNVEQFLEQSGVLSLPVPQASQTSP